MAKIKRHQVFLSHTSVDKPVVERFHETLRQYADIDPWLDKRMLAGENMLATITRQVAGSDCVLVFWSQHALRKYNSGKGIGGMPWVAFEIWTALEAGQKRRQRFIVVRLDDTPLDLQLVAHFNLTKHVDARGLSGNPRPDHGLIMWRAGIEIVSSLRDRPPIFPTLKLVRRNGRTLKRDHKYYFQDTWVDGYDRQGVRTNYIECLRPGQKAVAVKYDDGGLGYRFCLPNHVEGGFWTAAISFGVSDTDWHTVNLLKYKEMRFNARADKAGGPLAVSFADNHQGSVTESGHQETSNKIFHLGYCWQPGAPLVLRLDELDWSIKGFAGNPGGNKGNKLDVNRSEVLQIVFNNGGRSWEPGFRWMEVKNIVIL
jgi:hypothetical protein